MSDILPVNDQTFEQTLQRHGAVLVDFFSPTCAPCRLMEPGLKQLADSYAERVAFVKVNVNESPRTSSRFLIRSLPTLLFFRNGQVRTQLIGAVGAKQIERTLQEVMA